MKICTVDGCNGKQFGNGLCQRHSWQMNKYGQIMNTDRKGRSKENRYLIEGDIAIILLEDDFGFEKARAIIDREDLEKVKSHKWFLTKNSISKVQYVMTRINGTRWKLHQLILNFKSDNMTHIDHVNQNGLDNRKSNLRIATHSQNLCNCGLRKDNKTGYRGICFDRSRYVVNVTINHKTHRIGRFKKLDEAIIAHTKAVKELHGEFAYLNAVNS